MCMGSLLISLKLKGGVGTRPPSPPSVLDTKGLQQQGLCIFVFVSQASLRPDPCKPTLGSWQAYAEILPLIAASPLCLLRRGGECPGGTAPSFVFLQRWWQIFDGG